MTPSLRAFVLLGLLGQLPLHGAMAQVDVSGSVALQSAYRYRGQSPGDSGPAPQLTLNLDTAGGWYLGGFASGLTIGERKGYKLQSYAGFAQRLPSGWSWELGCSHTSYTQLHMNDFQECYGGLSGERVSGRLYYAPRYLGYDAHTLYGEVNLFYPLHPSVNLIAHAGLLHNLSKGIWPGIPAASRYDARLGVSVPLGDWTLQLAREQGQDDGIRYNSYPVHPSKSWSMSATYAF
ncbi:TorF family putative porin [Duganella aquatilis]|uniref:TorF family putative porin n=1 Tax=Duganella aquatilis TaxID=2666082 RepID=UPI003530FB43